MDLLHAYIRAVIIMHLLIECHTCYMYCTEASAPLVLHYIQQWLEKMEREQNATLAHEDPALTSEELDDKRRKLDRELLYLLNKLRSHPPPKLKKPVSKNATNNTTSNTTTTGGGGNSTENGATRNGASKPENEDKTGNEDEDEAVAGKDKGNLENRTQHHEVLNQVINNILPSLWN